MSDSLSSSAKWADLKTRIASAIVLMGIALAALYAPPMYQLFQLLMLAVIVIGFWELAGLCEPNMNRLRRAIVAASPVIAALIGAVYIIAAQTTMETGGLIMGGVMLLVIGVFVRRERLLFLGYGVVLALAVTFINYLFSILGPIGPLALVAVIAASDIAGYFAGRSFGGPKFWPRVSPKKTWSGTIAGWIASGIAGMILIQPIMAKAPELNLSVFAGLLIGVGLSFSGQLGDVIESAMKRKAGVKDASNLIPGHGGVLDRLDALIMAAALAYVTMLLIRAL
ncbi:MAG: phosphatidate cytidylyltransferase [Maritimibacter sp.]